MKYKLSTLVVRFTYKEINKKYTPSKICSYRNSTLIKAQASFSPLPPSDATVDRHQSYQPHCTCTRWLIPPPQKKSRYRIFLLPAQAIKSESAK